LSAVAHWKLGLEAGLVQHYNLRNMMDVTFGLDPGTDLGTATKYVEDAAKGVLPPSVNGAFTGEAQTFSEIVPMLIFLLIIAVFAMYLILGILYENYVDPIVVLTSLPIAGFGGLLTLVIFQENFSLYAFIGLFMLLGIVKKNGIMLIDFAKTHIEKEGATKEEAIFEASLTRCRPILMTSLAAIMGAVPIAMGFGADGASRRPLGLMVAGGLVFAQFITLYVTPSLYLYAEGAREWFHRKWDGHKPGGTGAPAA
jgi:HAE1 family hydrophobic/amphiphilic exporter-1